MPYTGPEPARRPLSSDDITDGIVSTADLADSAVTTAKITNNAVTAAKVSSDVSQLGKNLARNGAMTISQRGTSEASVFGSASGYGAWPDGYRSERSSGSESGRATFSQDSSGPPGFANCLKVLETTTDASPGASDYYRVVSRIEAQNLQHLAYGNAAAKTITLSFWVYSNLTGAFTVTLAQNDTARMYSTTYTVNVANTWEKKTITVPGDASGVINDDTGIGLEIGWMLGSGSNFQGGTQGSWATTANNMFGAGMTNNVLGSSAGDWRITGVQLEIGSVGTDFEHEDIGETQRKCDRYYQRYDGLYTLVLSGVCRSTTQGAVNTSLRAKMRNTPVGAASSADWANVIDDSDTGKASTSTTINESTDVGVSMSVNVSSGLTDGNGVIAELQASEWVEFDAEL